MKVESQPQAYTVDPGSQNWVALAPRGVGQCLETFMIVTAEGGMLLGFSG